MTATEATVGELGGASYGRTVAVLTFIAISAAVQQTALTPALPEIQKDLGVSTTAVAWLLTVFVVSATVATPILGRLSDIFGRDRVLLLICLTVAAGCLVGGLAHSLPVLIVARALQGLGGTFFAIAFGILRDEAPPGRRATGFGLVSSSYGVGGGIGFLLSGVVVDQLSYSWIFWIAFAMFATASLATYLFISESPLKTPASIDWIGAGLMTGGLLSALLGVSESVRFGWGSRPVLTLLGAGLVFLLVWAAWEVRRREPLVDLRLMRNRGVWTMNATSALTGFGMYLVLLLVPKFVQTGRDSGYGFGASVTGAGLFLMPWTILMMLAAASSGFLANRFGSRQVLRFGTVFFSFSFVWLALLHGARWHVLVGVGGLGIGIGLCHSSMANLLAHVVPHAQVGEAMGVLSIGRSIGSAVGAQVGATIVASLVVAGVGTPRESAYTIAFWISAVLGAGAFACAVIVPNDKSSQPD